MTSAWAGDFFPGSPQLHKASPQNPTVILFSPTVALSSFSICPSCCPGLSAFCVMRPSPSLAPEVSDSHTSHCSLAFVNWKAFSLVYFRANIPLCPPNTCSFLDPEGQKYCRAEGCNCSTRRRGAGLGHPSEPSVSVKRVPPARWHAWFLALQNQDLKLEGCPAMARGRFCYSMWSPSFPKLVKEHGWH